MDIILSQMLKPPKLKNMKKSTLLLNLFIATFLFVGLSSCEKDDDDNDNTNNTAKTIQVVLCLLLHHLCWGLT